MTQFSKDFKTVRILPYYGNLKTTSRVTNILENIALFDKIIAPAHIDGKCINQLQYTRNWTIRHLLKTNCYTRLK